MKFWTIVLTGLFVLALVADASAGPLRRLASRLRDGRCHAGACR